MERGSGPFGSFRAGKAGRGRKGRTSTGPAFFFGNWYLPLLFFLRDPCGVMVDKVYQQGLLAFC
jgi:hypothetical protein